MKLRNTLMRVLVLTAGVLVCTLAAIGAATAVGTTTSRQRTIVARFIF
jgi:hypothetical protein